MSRKIRLPFNEVLNKLTLTLEQQGFGILATMDIRNALKKNLNVDFRNYKVVGACIPALAYGALSLESHMGVLLACNIVIQEHENAEVEVSAFNPLETIDHGIADTTSLGEIAEEVSIRLRNAIDDLHRDADQIKDEEALPLDNCAENIIAPVPT
jgi:uncharacterized protein (DUF302 family)